MTETKEHKFLKLLGVLYLHKVNCRLAATEVYVSKISRHLGEEFDDLTNKVDNIYVMDCVGVAMKPITKDKTYRCGYVSKEKIGEEPVTKGIEVKISRSDLNNGYACTGLNYHYLLVPKDLVKLKEIPKHVGVLEYDPETKHPSAYNLNIKRRPIFQNTPDYSIRRIETQIIKRQHGSYMDVINDQMKLLHREVFNDEI